MFTGIIKKVGKISEIEKIKNGARLTIAASGFLKDVEIGNSISCDGVCLTVVKKIKDEFTVELMPETLKLTKFKNSKKSDSVNLEKSLKIGCRLDGHFVMGHIDGVGRVEKIITRKKFREIVIKIPKKLAKYLALKGSAALNGVSLTVSGVNGDRVKVSLIAHTLENTNLSELKKGDLVNVEVDMIARYIIS